LQDVTSSCFFLLAALLSENFFSCKALKEFSTNFKHHFRFNRCAGSFLTGFHRRQTRENLKISDG